MGVQGAAGLPYRTRAEDLVLLLDALSRGRTLKQLGSIGISPSTIRGLIAAGRGLGLLGPVGSELTDLGSEFAVASDEERRLFIRRQLLSYEPYSLLLEAVFLRQWADSLPLDWMEKWWNKHGYGSSPTNRREAASTLASLIEYSGLGLYVVGRRGRPSRVVWRSDVQRLIEQVASVHPGPPLPDRSGANRRSTETESAAHHHADLPPWTERAKNNVVTVTFPGGDMARLSLPARLRAEDKRRLVTLVETMIAEVFDAPRGEDPD